MASNARQESDTYDPETVVVGVVGRPHGLGGEVTLRPYNLRGSALRDADSLILDRDGKRTTYQVLSRRPGPTAVIARLAGVDDRTAAEALTLSLVRLSRSALPPLEPGEFYVEDVVGCQVVHVDGTVLGTAVGTFWSGAHDVMTVAKEGEDTREAEAAGELMIPLIPEFVRTVDAVARRIEVDWSEGDA